MINKNKEFNKIKPYTYFIIRKIDGKKYHGVRWGNKYSPEQDLGKKYFTSSKYISDDFKSKPNNYIYKFKWTFNSVKDAINYETLINKKIYKKVDWINKNAFPAIFNEIPTMLGKKRSDEFRKKVAEWNKIYKTGSKHSEISKNKIRKSLLGKKHTELSKDKMSKNRKGKHAGIDHYNFGKKLPINHPFIISLKNKKGVPLKDETKNKISLSNKGKVRSEIFKNRLSILNSGKNNPMFGKKQSIETRKKISEKAKLRFQKIDKSKISGKNHHLHGKKMSKEQKLKISKSLKGKNNPMFGKKHSMDTIEKMRKIKVGKRLSPETINKLIGRVPWNKGLKIGVING